MSVFVSYPNPQTAVLTPVDGEEWGAELVILMESNSPVECVILDMKRVEYLSSNTIGSLESLSRKLSRCGKKLAVVNLSTDIAEIFHTTKLDRMISVNETIGSEVAEVANQRERSREVVSAAHSVPAGESFASHLKKEEEFPLITEEDYRFADDWSFVEEQQAQWAFEQYTGMFGGVYKRNIVGVAD